MRSTLTRSREGSAPRTENATPTVLKQSLPQTHYNFTGGNFQFDLIA